MKSYDVVVVGSGPGGYVSAIRAAQLGASAAVVERDTVGGVCLNWGCIPTKTLIHSADVLAAVGDAASVGVSISGTVSADWPAMMKRKDRVVRKLSKGVEALLKGNGVDLVEGTARFVDRKHLAVRDNDGETTRIRADKVIIATGGKPVWPSFLPAPSPRLLTSRAALQMDSLPDSIVILGGGIIGCEWACMFARMGVSVTVIELLTSILPGQDDAASRTLTRSMKALGIDLRTDTRLEAVEETDHGIRATVGGDTLEADCMLVSVGRQPQTEGLEVGTIGVELGEQGSIPIDTRCSTNVPGVYAIGDVTGGVQLAHRASAMGTCAAENALGGRAEHSDALVPACIFTTPEIGSVGWTEKQAEAEGVRVRTGTFPFQALGKALAIGEDQGGCTVVADAETDQVLGVHIVGPHATDLISEAAAAMRLEVTAEELGDVIHPHPTLSEALMEAAHDVHDDCIHLPPTR